MPERNLSLSPIRSPKPQRNSANIRSQSSLNLARFHSPLAHSFTGSGSDTPVTTELTTEQQRTLEHYNLDYPSKAELPEILDSKSRFYGRKFARRLNLQKALPYRTELPIDSARYLSHIVSHLYIAICALDFDGLISISLKDLEAARNEIHLQDEDIDSDVMFEEDEDDYIDTDVNDDYSISSDFDVFDDLAYYGDGKDDFIDEYNEDNLSEDISNGVNSAVNADMDSSLLVGVHRWTKELRVWIKMKNDMPFSLRIALARVYYNLCLVSGAQSSISSFGKMFGLLISVEDNELIGLELDPLPLLKLLCVPNKFSRNKELGRNKLQELHNVAYLSKFYFPKETFILIWETVGSSMTLENSVQKMRLLQSMTPCSSEFFKVLPSIFHLWHALSNNEEFNLPATELIGEQFRECLRHYDEVDRSVCKFSEYGFLDDDQLTFVFTTLLRSLDLSSKRSRKDKTHKVYTFFAEILVYSINGSQVLQPGNNYFNRLELLFNGIETFLHPSNYVPGTKNCCRLIYNLLEWLVHRYKHENDPKSICSKLPDELKLNEDVINRFIDIALPTVLMGLHSKISSITNRSIDNLYFLCELSPEKVMSVILPDIYESVQNVISVHRLSVSLKVIQRLARFFASVKGIRCHTTSILIQILPGIDPNDASKTFLTFGAIGSIATYVPICDLTKTDPALKDEVVDPAIALEFTANHLNYLSEMLYGQKDGYSKFEFNEDFEKKALAASTTFFNQFLSSFTFTLFNFLENVPDLSNIAFRSNLEENIVRSMLLMFEAMDDTLFDILSDKFLDYLSENPTSSDAHLISRVVGAFVKRSPQKSGSKFMDFYIKKTHEEYKNGVDLMTRSSKLSQHEKPFYFAMVNLGEIILNMGPMALQYGFEISNLSRMLFKEVKGYSRLVAGELPSKLLKSLTCIRLKEQRLIAPWYVKAHGITEKCWGAFYDQPGKFESQNLQFEWYLPSKKDVEFAVQFFGELVHECCENLVGLMSAEKHRASKQEKDDETTNYDLLEFGDSLRKNCHFLDDCLIGIAYLLDPDYGSEDTHTHRNSDKLNAKVLDKRLRALHLSQNSTSSVNTTTIVDSELPHSSNNNLNSTFASTDSLDKLSQNVSTPDIGLKKVDSLSSISSFTSVASDLPKQHGENQKSSDDLSEAANCQITSRSQKLYTSSYFFGDSIEERLKHELYKKLHQTHRKVGEVLHEVLQFLLANYPYDVQSFEACVYTVRTYLVDIGANDFIEDFDESFISYKKVYSIQRSTRGKSTLTRVSLGSRIERYHRQRVLMHACSHFKTKTDQNLLIDLAKVAMSPNSTIANCGNSILTSSMKKVIGSYTPVINTVLDSLEEALKKEGVKDLSAVMDFFLSDRIFGRICNDYRNLKRYTTLLLKCIADGDKETNASAMTLYSNLAPNMRVPNSIRAFDEKLIECIRPPDNYADTNIKLLKFAKERKKQFYLSKVKELQKFIYINESDNHPNWKLSLVNVETLGIFQNKINIVSNAQIMGLLIKRASSKHPSICSTAIGELYNVLHKIIKFSNSSYSMNIFYDPDCLENDRAVISTDSKSLGYNFSVDLRKEFSKDSDFDYLLKANEIGGFFFWGKQLEVSKGFKDRRLNLNDHDSAVLKRLNKFLTKDWFDKVSKFALENYEGKSHLEGGFFKIIALLIILIDKGFVTNISLQDIIETAEGIYVAGNEEANFVIFEILVGILRSSKVTNCLENDMLRNYMSDIMKKVYKDVTPKQFKLWRWFLHLITSEYDYRMGRSLVKEVIDSLPSHGEGTPFQQSTKIGFQRSIVRSLLWRYPNKDVSATFAKMICLPYQSARAEVAKIMSKGMYCEFDNPSANFEEFVGSNADSGSLGKIPFQLADSSIEWLKNAFDETEHYRLELPSNLTATEVLNSKYCCAARTLLEFLVDCIGTAVSMSLIEIIPSHISPFLLNFAQMRDVCSLANVAPGHIYCLLAIIPFRKEFVPSMVEMILNKGGIKELSWHQKLSLLNFVVIFHFYQLFTLTEDEKQQIFSFTTNLLFDKSLEVREIAAKSLSGMIHFSSTSERNKMINSSIEKFEVVLKKYKRFSKRQKFLKSNKGKVKTFNQSDSIQLHGATLGLGALVSAFPYLSPPPKWLPEVLSLLANNAFGLSGIVDKASKDTLSNFKKTRQDTWHIDSVAFTSDQLEDLEGVLRVNYFV